MSRLFTTLRQHVDPGLFFVPGLAGIPIGALYGGYNAVAHSKHKCMMINAAQFGVQTLGGSLIGGLLGTVWPISATAFALSYAAFWKKRVI